MESVINLLEIRNLYGLSQTDFARKVKMSRELVSKIENGKIELKKPTWKKIQKFLEQQPLQNFSQDVNIVGKPVNMSYQERRREKKNDDLLVQIPLVGIKAQAGYIKSFEQMDYVDTLQKYSPPPGVNTAGAVWRYFEVDGDSMEPELSSGDAILATMVPGEDWQELKNFCVCIIHTEDKLLVKRIYKKSPQQWVLISDNEENYPQVLLNTDEIKQIWLFRRHIRSKLPQRKEFVIVGE